MNCQPSNLIVPTEPTVGRTILCFSVARVPYHPRDHNHTHLAAFNSLWATSARG